MGVIYKATCDVTGKSYIGQTKRTLAERRKQHEKGVGNYYFQRAIKKYGKDHFEWSILEECDNTILNDREIYWINFFNTYTNGYNSTCGGDNADALIKWKQHNPEKVLENALNGLQYANRYNRQHKEERLEQLASVRQKGADKVKRSVQCVELGIIFESLSEAEKWSLSTQNPNGKKAAHQHISKVCKGQRKTAGGYTWKYIN